MAKPTSDNNNEEPVATFTVARTAYLDPRGQTLRALPEWAEDVPCLKRLLRTMTLARRFDARAVSLQRTGQLGTYATALGQEAVPVGVVDAMRPEDVLLPTYREAAAQYARGVSLAEVLLYWGGDEQGSAYTDCRADFPPCIPVGSQLPHAAGVAFALKRAGDGGVAVTFVGDGGTSKGDFYEAINLAGVWRLPMVVVINNNQWAISVARQQQTAAETLAQKAIAAGIAGVQVDGNDVIAVAEATRCAIARARDGAPGIIEAVTYRLADHTTTDDATRYRDAQEVEAAQRRDPIHRLTNYLKGIGAVNDQELEALEADCQREIEAAVKQYENAPQRSPETLFDHLYAEMPESLARQRAAFSAHLDAQPGSDDHG